jgi:3-keto-5-aminohexanoate cleavage enzyme
VLCQFCLGFDGGAPATPEVLLRLAKAIPSTWLWSAVGVGDDGLATATLAITLGGHVRVGIEDHPYYRPGTLATTNAELVARIVRLAGELDRGIATPADVRDLLALPDRTASFA